MPLSLKSRSQNPSSISWFKNKNNEKKPFSKWILCEQRSHAFGLCCASPHLEQIGLWYLFIKWMIRWIGAHHGGSHWQPVAW